MSDNFFLDSNIIVYAYDQRDLDKKVIAQALLSSSLAGQRGVLSTQVFSEVFVTLTTKLKPALTKKQCLTIFNLLGHLTVCEVDLPLVLEAIDLQESWQLSYWDSLILAAAKKSHCEIIYSEDFSHTQDYGGIQVINPFISAKK